MIYLDNNATTRIHSEVLEAMLPFYGEHFGNPSSFHSQGRHAKEAVALAREKAAVLLGAENGEYTIIFTSGGTEANNLAIKGPIEYLAKADTQNSHSKHIIISAIEHASILNISRELERKGVEVTHLPVDENGIIKRDELISVCRPNTVMISIMLANNETGVIQPIREICKIANEANIPVHTDAVQAVGKIAVDIKKLGVDLLSISGHKFHGPQGVGALFVKRGTKIVPVLHGGGQENRLRSGTENVPGIIGLGKAAELAYCNMQKNVELMSKLIFKLKKGIISTIDDVRINGPDEPKGIIPNTLSVSFKDVESEALATRLDMAGIMVSTGAACSSHEGESSHVLKAMNVPIEYRYGTIRFSVSVQNTGQEIDKTVEILRENIGGLRTKD